MKLKLNKKKMKSLSKDNKAIPAAMTPQVAGAGPKEILSDIDDRVGSRCLCWLN
ncbi:hypothetical protein [Pseudoalteromonas phenolica]|uniref:hypothetical protein n=1 Tax=Pseudoalteromonas phenolica TaxID=161398 RepID=UPI0014873EAC|nr:hypothetical protein [Pseudoalteromonas phenolica]